MPFQVLQRALAAKTIEAAEDVIPAQYQLVSRLAILRRVRAERGTGLSGGAAIQAGLNDLGMTQAQLRAGVTPEQAAETYRQQWNAQREVIASRQDALQRQGIEHLLFVAGYGGKLTPSEQSLVSEYQHNAKQLQQMGPPKRSLTLIDRLPQAAVDKMLGDGTAEALAQTPGFWPQFASTGLSFLEPKNLATMGVLGPLGKLSPSLRLFIDACFLGQAAAGIYDRAQSGDVSGALGQAAAFAAPGVMKKGLRMLSEGKAGEPGLSPHPTDLKEVRVGDVLHTADGAKHQVVEVNGDTLKLRDAQGAVSEVGREATKASTVLVERAPVSRRQVETAFGAARIKPFHDATGAHAGYDLHLPNGQVWGIRFPNEIALDPEAVRAEYQREPGPNDFAAGRTFRLVAPNGEQMGLAGIIELAKGTRPYRFTDRADLQTLLHESLHMARRMGVIASQEWELLVKRYAPNVQGETAQEGQVAQAYESWGKGTKGPAIFHRVQRFFSGLLDRVMRDGLHAKTDQIFEALCNGRMFERPPQEVQAAVDAAHYSLKERYQEELMPYKRGRYRNYVGVEDLTDDRPRVLIPTWTDHTKVGEYYNPNTGVRHDLMSGRDYPLIDDLYGVSGWAHDGSRMGSAFINAIRRIVASGADPIGVILTQTPEALLGNKDAGAIYAKEVEAHIKKERISRGELAQVIHETQQRVLRSSRIWLSPKAGAIMQQPYGSNIAKFMEDLKEMPFMLRRFVIMALGNRENAQLGMPKYQILLKYMSEPSLRDNSVGSAVGLIQFSHHIPNPKETKLTAKDLDVPENLSFDYLVPGIGLGNIRPIPMDEVYRELFRQTGIEDPAQQFWRVYYGKKGQGVPLIPSDPYLFERYLIQPGGSDGTGLQQESSLDGRGMEGTFPPRERDSRSGDGGPGSQGGAGPKDALGDGNQSPEETSSEETYQLGQRSAPASSATAKAPTPSRPRLLIDTLSSRRMAAVNIPQYGPGASVGSQTVIASHPFLPVLQQTHKAREYVQALDLDQQRFLDQSLSVEEQAVKTLGNMNGRLIFTGGRITPDELQLIRRQSQILDAQRAAIQARGRDLVSERKRMATVLSQPAPDWQQDLEGFCRHKVLEQATIPYQEMLHRRLGGLSQLERKLEKWSGLYQKFLREYATGYGPWPAMPSLRATPPKR